MDTNIEQEKNESGITLGQIFFLIKKNIILIIIVTFFVTLIGSVYAIGFKKPTYTGTATIMVDDASGQVSGNEYQQYLLSSYLVNSIKDFVTSDAVLSEVKEATGVSVKALANNISVSTTNNSLIVKVAYSNTDKELTLQVTKLLIEKSVKVSNTVKEMSPEGTPVYKYSMLANKIIDLKTPQTFEDLTVKSGKLIILVVSFLLGLIISFGIVLVMFLLDDTYRSKQTFEQTFGINVLASIPNVKVSKGDK